MNVPAQPLQPLVAGQTADRNALTRELDDAELEEAKRLMRMQEAP